MTTSPRPFPEYGFRAHAPAGAPAHRDDSRRRHDGCVGADGAHHAAVARSVIALALSLGVRTCAEGIADITQLMDLQGLGCAQGQGSYFSEPLPADAVSDWLVRDRGRPPLTPSPGGDTPLE